MIPWGGRGSESSPAWRNFRLERNNFRSMPQPSYPSTKKCRWADEAANAAPRDLFGPVDKLTSKAIACRFVISSQEFSPVWSRRDCGHVARLHRDLPNHLAVFEATQATSDSTSHLGQFRSVFRSERVNRGNRKGSTVPLDRQSALRDNGSLLGQFLRNPLPVTSCHRFVTSAFPPAGMGRSVVLGGDAHVWPPDLVPTIRIALANRGYCLRYFAVTEKAFGSPRSSGLGVRAQEKPSADVAGGGMPSEVRGPLA